MNYNEISHCRLSKENDLVNVVDLGTQAFTGIFPASSTEEIPVGPLQLCWSPSSSLLQLRHTFNLELMYGDNYGYRSGLNKSMVQHLSNKVRFLESIVQLNSSDTVSDIGSNDGTTLNSYINQDVCLAGFDPTAEKFREFYNSNIKVSSDFFSKENYFATVDRPSKIITSLSMFYDLEDPISFAADIFDCLDDNGIWHLEQSYLPSMIRANSYDTVCHEHLEYYSLHNICDILSRNKMHVIDVKLNSINGGSFAVTAAKKSSKYIPHSTYINFLLSQEKLLGLHTPKPFLDFQYACLEHRTSLINLLDSIISAGHTIAGYGASTKGNVLLQYCGLSTQYLDFVYDINPYKHGRFTPGTHIPITNEPCLDGKYPDYFLVLPWHFKDFILLKETDLISKGIKFIFPFPFIEIV